MSLENFVAGVKGFSGFSFTEKVKLFGWFLHEQKKMEFFTVKNVKECFLSLSLEEPTNIGSILAALEAKRPKEVLRESRGFRLEKRVRDELNVKFGSRPSTVHVTALLKSLPDRIGDLSEKAYLNEAILCLQAGAPRASIVMAWNLVYHHLVDRILNDQSKLAHFNATWLTKYKGMHKSKVKTVSSLDEFGEELKEREVIEIMYAAKLISKEVHKNLVEKLGKRNTSAHPSNVELGHLQAEAYIEDIVLNVLLKV